VSRRGELPESVAGLPAPRVAATALIAVIATTTLAFGAAQRLKRAAPIIDPDEIHALKLFSPGLSGGAARARFQFKMSKADTLTVSIVTPEGDPVRTIAKDVERTPGQRFKGQWNGARDSGQPAPDGEYKVQVAFRDAGRAVLLPGVVLTKDTTPPAPKLLSIGPEKDPSVGEPRPELLPRADGKPIRVRYRVAGRSAGITVFRTDLARPRAILEEPIGEGDGQWTWDGTVDGRRVPQGTYLVAVHAKDFVGNIGWSTGSAQPVAAYGSKLDGRGGVVVRYLAAQSPEAPVAAGTRAGIGVISPAKDYRWSIRRVGESRVRSRGVSQRAYLRPKVPSGTSGLYRFDLRTKDRSATSVILTQSRTPQPVLIVIPQTSLVGSALVDDDGDGAPDTLARGVAVQTGRVPTNPELPADLADHIAPLLVSLDRKDRRYDLTTDLALARGVGPKLRGHEGVVLAGKAEFVDRGVQRQLSTWVQRGGRLWVSEPGSLLRTVTVTQSQATNPTQASRLDPFGFELGPLQRVSRVEQLSDRARLWRGTDGRFEGPLMVEPIVRAPGDGSKLSEGTTPGGGQPVLQAVEVGRGAVVRTGIEGFGARSLRDPDVREFLRRLWSFLRGG
jgi:FlgD Ig-like domain